MDGWRGSLQDGRVDQRRRGVCEMKSEISQLRDVGGGRGTLDYSILLSSPLQKYQLLSLNICPLSDAAPQEVVFFF